MDLFDRILNGGVPCEKVYEDEKTFAFLDISPVSKGHTLVIPKQHAEYLAEQSEEDAVALMKTVYLLAPKIMAALGATGYNLGMNHGKDAGQEVPHTHLHIMPRYEGEERTFEKRRASDEELAEVAGKIRKELE